MGCSKNNFPPLNAIVPFELFVKLPVIFTGFSSAKTPYPPAVAVTLPTIEHRLVPLLRYTPALEFALLPLPVFPITFPVIFIVAVVKFATPALAKVPIPLLISPTMFIIEFSPALTPNVVRLVKALLFPPVTLPVKFNVPPVETDHTRVSLSFNTNRLRSVY